jgi:hypothetical protein
MPPIARRLFAPVILALLSLVAVTACPGPTEKKKPASATGGACGTVIAPSRSNLSAGEKNLVAYPHQDALWIYDISADRVMRVRSGLASGDRADPQFLDPQHITFVDRREEDENLPFGLDSLYIVDVGTGKAQELLRLNATLLSYRWNSDRSRLAYEVASTVFRMEDGKQVPFGVNDLCMYDVAGRETRAIRRLEYIVGRGGDESNERRIIWSPSGDSVLLVDTIQPTMQVVVVDVRGQDLVPPQPGTFARWLDEQTIMFRQENRLGVDGKLRKGRWFTLNVVTAERKSFGFPNGASRPEISPDGRLIAFDDADPEDPSTYVFERATGESRLLLHGYGAPIWLSNQVVAVTAGGACPPRTECNNLWTPLGRTIAVDVRQGSRERLALPTTGPFSTDVDVLLVRPK